MLITSNLNFIMTLYLQLQLVGQKKQQQNNETVLFCVKQMKVSCLEMHEVE